MDRPPSQPLAALLGADLMSAIDDIVNDKSALISARECLPHRWRERQRRGCVTGTAVSRQTRETPTKMTSCLIGMEACAGAHQVGRKLVALVHDVRLIPAKHVKPFLKGHKNDYRDAGAVQRSTISSPQKAPSNSPYSLSTRAQPAGRSTHGGDQPNLRFPSRAWHYSTPRTIRYGKRSPSILAWRTGNFRHSSCGCFRDLVRRLDRRTGDITTQIKTLAKQDENCERLMGTPGVGPLIASAMFAALGDSAAFIKGREFAAWLGLVRFRWRRSAH